MGCHAHSQALLGNAWTNSSSVRGVGKQSLLYMHSQTEFGNENCDSLSVIVIIFLGIIFIACYLSRIKEPSRVVKIAFFVIHRVMG